MATGTTYPIPKPDKIRVPEYAPNYDSLVTEDEKPVDNVYSERQHALLTNTLIDSWKGPGEGCPRFITTNVGLFYSDNEPPFAPDVLVSLDVSPPQGELSLKENRSYYIWKYNKPPDLLVEVVSNTEGGELTTKMKGYARLGALYYVVWDPFQFLGKKDLYCFALERRKYVPCDTWFPELELGLRIWEGAYGDMPATYLRWCDRDGNLIPTGAERAEQEKQRAKKEKQRAKKEKQRAGQEKQRAEQEKQRAEQEKQRAEQEKQHAKKEKQRADKLAEKLRALGFDPNGQ
jgi:hypothetical protein